MQFLLLNNMPAPPSNNAKSIVVFYSFLFFVDILDFDGVLVRRFSCASSRMLGN